MPSIGELRQVLNRIDGRGYNAYHEIRSEFGLGGFTLFVDHVQGDPFAAPSTYDESTDTPIKRPGSWRLPASLQAI